MLPWVFSHWLSGLTHPRLCFMVYGFRLCCFRLCLTCHIVNVADIKGIEYVLDELII